MKTAKQLSNLVDRINTKIRNYEKEGNTQPAKYYKKIQENIINKYDSIVNLRGRGSGKLSKGVTKWNKLSQMQIDDVYATLSNASKHEIYGTSKKYERYIDTKNKRFRDSIVKTIGNEYASKFTDEDLRKLQDRLDAKRKEGQYTSEQLFLEYYQDELSTEDEERMLKGIINNYKEEMDFLSRFKIGNNNKYGGND